jgi:uncharacterized protein YpmB
MVVGYNVCMENIALVICIVAVVWLVLVVSFLVYFWLRIMPVVRQMQETVEGQLALARLMFPPRFRR